MSRLGLLALLASAMLFLAGCANDPVLAISTWTLDAPGVSAQVTIPLHLGDRFPEFVARPTRYTLRARVTLTDDLRGRDLTLAIPQLFALTRLEVSGHPLDALDAEDADRYRAVGPHRWRIPATMTESGAVDLALVVDHTWTQSAWLDTAPRLSATPHGDRSFLFTRAFNATTAFAATTTLLMSAFVYGVVFLIDRRRRAYGWFALHAMGAFYPMFQLGFMQVWIGSGDVLAMGVFVVLGNVSAVHFTHAQFGLGAPNRVWHVACAVTITLAVVMSGPFASTRPMGILSMGVTISNVLFQIVFFTRRLVRQRSVPLHTLAILISWTLLGASALADFGWWFGWGELWGGLHGAHLGIAGIAVLQSAALAHEHTRSLQTSDALNVELAGRVDLLEQRNLEVDHLNDELRRQIAARSQQLADLLARDGRTGITGAALATGYVVGSRYRIVRAIGEGGMGAVYEVARIKDERRFALKVLHGQTGSEAMARFAREAQLASQIDHPNIVSVVDVDVTADGTLFLVMEFVDGPSLESERARFGDTAWARPLLSQIATGLAAIHAKGIVHRDLKPANVLLATNGDGSVSLAKIADFGISTLAPELAWNKETVRESPLATTLAPGAPGGDGAQAASLTRTGVIMGTPRYMAPEMFVSAKKARLASDVFSFGVIASELLTGRHPFAEGSALSIVQRKPASPTPPSIATFAPSLNVALVDCLDRCLDSDAARRPTIVEIVAALA